MSASGRFVFVPSAMKKVAVILCLVAVTALAQQNSACPPAGVVYTKKPVDTTKVRLQLHPKITESLPDDQQQLSPHGTRWFVQQIGQKAVVTIGENQKILARVTMPSGDGNGITARWINEKLLFLEYFPGNSVSVDLILDVEAGKFIYSDTAKPGSQQFCNQPSAH